MIPSSSLLLLSLLLLSLSINLTTSYDLYQLIPQPLESSNAPKLLKYSPYTASLSIVFHASRSIDIEYLYLNINYLHSYLQRQSPTYVICLTDEKDPGMYIPNGKTILIINQHTLPKLGPNGELGLTEYSNLYNQRCTTCSLGLIHLNHELTNLERDWVNKTQLVEVYNEKFEYVVRNYYDDILCNHAMSGDKGGGNGRSNSSAICIPLGPCNIRVKVGKELESSENGECEERTNLCSFIGNLDSPTSRSSLQLMEAKCEVHDSKGLRGTGVGDVPYEGLLRRSRYCLVPGGNNWETFRVYESLEWECVGVINSLEEGYDNWKKMIKQYTNIEISKAFIVCNEGWGENCLLKLSESEEDYERRKKVGERFWREVKTNVRGEIIQAVSRGG
ncbi:hypothetical protein TrLO_g5105 [Triparma laevis f. longispina]|uniref:Exostosin GT47 domain-containing protein n=1 Tax=Triparma laevis f. longispina TaxID=1714387 RepID=A0A9W6ZLS5_9STRA|nr:hypothetical protein TrLO_g5105 [Triparma laevis f. longispina]